MSDSTNREQLWLKWLENQNIPDLNEKLILEFENDPAFLRECWHDLQIESLLIVSNQSPHEFQSSFRARFLSENDGQDLVESVRLKISPKQKVIQKRFSGLQKETWLAIAASIMLCFGLAYWLNPLPDTSTQTESTVNVAHELSSPSASRQTGFFIDSIRGDVQIKNSVGQSVIAESKMELAPDDEIQLNDKAQLTLVLDSGKSIIRFSKGAKFKTTAGKITVLTGRLLADIYHYQRNEKLKFITPHAKFKILGTRFKISVKENNSHLTVTQGRVEASEIQHPLPLLVETGQTLLLGPGILPKVQSLSSFKPIVLYQFDEGHGMVVKDRSMSKSPVDLKIQNNAGIEWQGGGGLTLHQPNLLKSVYNSTKINQKISSSGEMSLECWIQSSTARFDIMAIPARIITMDNDTFFLGQGTMRNPENNKNGSNDVYVTRYEKNDILGIASENISDITQLNHVIYTLSDDGSHRFYVNGKPKSGRLIDENFAPITKLFIETMNWPEEGNLLLGNRKDMLRPWTGTYYKVAIYDRELKKDEVETLYRQGY